MCNYHCPFAERKAVAGFLLCRDLFKEDVNYNVRENAMGVICAFQKQCMKTGKMENTDAAKECYRMRTEAKQASAVSEFVTGTSEYGAEAAPVELKISTTVSKSGKKKKG